MSDLKQPFGIDLGTTYSVIAHLDRAGRPEPIENRDGQRTTPSVILFDPSGEIVVGSIAKNEAVMAPGRVVEMVKRYMGSEGWQRTIDGHDYKPEELSAFILEKLARDAKEATGVPVEDVVITHPAYFTDVERAATRAAGTIAGLNVLGLIEEPVAAAFAYSMASEKGLSGNVLVYDLGGGTFDACVIRVTPVGDGGRDISVVVTEGQRTLGGKDWDARILGYVLSELSARTGLHLDEYGSGALGEEAADSFRELLQELTTRVEDAKVGLSGKPKVRIAVPAFEGRREIVELTREQFDEMTADLLLQTIDLTRQALDQAREKGVASIDTVLLVGGASRMLQVEPAVTGLVGPGVEVRLFEPDLAVAKGAAYVAWHKELIKPQAGADATFGEPLTPSQAPGEDAHKERVADALDLIPEHTIGEIGTTSFWIVVPHSLGIVAYDDAAPTSRRVSHIIPAQTRLPVSRMRTYALHEDGQRAALIEVKQGDSDVPDECHDLGQVKVELPVAMARGTKIEVTFTMGEEGTLTVTGRQPDTSVVVVGEVQRPATMSGDEIKAAATHLAGLPKRE